MFVGVSKKKKIKKKNKKKNIVCRKVLFKGFSFTNFYSILRQQLPKFYTHKHYTLSCHAENDTQCQKSELF